MQLSNHDRFFCAARLFLTGLSFLAFDYLLQRLLLKTGLSSPWAAATSRIVLGAVAFALYRHSHREDIREKPAASVIAVWILTGFGASLFFSLVSGQQSIPDTDGISVLVYGIIAPITEELIYRGLILSQAQCAFGDRISIIISSLLFAAGHPQHWVAALCFGMLLALSVFRYRTLAAPVAIHVVVNLLSFIRFVPSAFLPLG